jgi:signal transduction histidine kinase
MGGVQTRSLRRRVLGSIVGVTALAVVLFAAPLAYVLAAAYHSAAVTTLQAEAARVAATVPDSLGTDGSTVTLPANLPRYLTVGVYRVDGARIALGGPDRSPVAAAAGDGHLHDRVEQDNLAVAAPVPSDEQITLTVRVAEPYLMVRGRILTAWALMATLAALVIGLATLLARRQARQIAQPLERLTANARALGGGDFTVRAARSGIAEADAAGAALESTAQQLGNLLERERAFSADVSHQLRTPLTALLLGLEADLNRTGADLRAAGERALRRAEQLRDTVDDLLGLARDTHRAGTPLDVPRLLAELTQRWHEPYAIVGRRLTVPDAPDLPAVSANPAAVRQILDVMLDNALTHGAGSARVDVVDMGGAISIEVSDEGGGLAGDPEDAFVRRADGAAARSGHGIGLALARSLAEADGGRLVVRRAAPHPVFSLLLPDPGAPPRSDSPGPARS